MWFENDTEKVTMVWSFKKGNGGRSVEISGRNGSIRKGEVGRPRKTWKYIVKRDLELLGVEESVALDRGRWRKIIACVIPAYRENMDFKQK